jgi:hypothetical protein
MSNWTAIALAVVACGCRGILGIEDVSPAGADGSIDTPDARADAPTDAPASSLRAGNLAFLQLTVDNAEARSVGLSGASLSLRWDDVATVPAPSFEGGGCEVTRFMMGVDSPPRHTDEGRIDVTGFGRFGDLTCSFVQVGEAEGGYSCVPAVSPDGTVSAGSSISVVDEAVATWLVSIPGATFPPGGARGMFLSFPAGIWSNAGNAGIFPIIEQVDDNSIIIVNPAGVEETLAADSLRYFLTVSNAVIPGGFDVLEGAGDFSIVGGGAGEVEPFDIVVTPAGISTGSELVLASSSLDPDRFPQTAADTEVGCQEAEGGNCENGGIINALIVSGRTTDGVISPTGNPVLDATSMPPPIAEFATFTCIFIGSKSGIIPDEAITEILATAPTRIETRVVFGSGTIVSDEKGNVTNMIAGYGLVGFSDISTERAPTSRSARDRRGDHR